MGIRPRDPQARVARTRELISRFPRTSSLEFYRQWVASGEQMPFDEFISVTGRLLDDGLSVFTSRPDERHLHAFGDRLTRRGESLARRPALPRTVDPSAQELRA